jgi:hypothetical protein
MYFVFARKIFVFAKIFFAPLGTSLARYLLCVPPCCLVASLSMSRCSMQKYNTQIFFASFFLRLTKIFFELLGLIWHGTCYCLALFARVEK